MAAWKISLRVSLRGLQREDGWRTLKERSEARFIRDCKTRVRFFYPLPFYNQGGESNWKRLKAGRYQFEGVPRVDDNKGEQVGKHQGNQQFAESTN